MIRPMAAAAGLALLAASAQATLVQAAPAGPRYVSLPIETSPTLAQAPRPVAEASQETLKGPPETTASLKAPPGKPWCPDGRIVGTGVGFCLIN